MADPNNMNRSQGQGRSGSPGTSNGWQMPDMPDMPQMAGKVGSFEIFTVSEVTQRVAHAVARDPVLGDIWVNGEIANFTHHSSGHMYFTLKDDSSRLRAVMFRGNNLGLRFRPAEGMRIYAHGNIGVYERGGEYQLYVDLMEPAGIGALYLAFQQLRAKLQAEGLFDPAAKRPLPKFPRRLGVVTSPTGAAVRDIITVTRRRWPGIDILIIPALVQGPDAPRSIVQAIQLANGVSNIDVLIVGRGGGSAEELWAFNDEDVARAIRGSRVPVVSAVGHETDFTIADFAADMRAPTPSAAAELVVPDASAYARHLQLLESRLVRSVSMPIMQRRQNVDELSRRLFQSIQTKVRASRDRLDHLFRMLEALDPEAVLGRGYAICRGPDGALLRRAEGVLHGDEVRVQLGRGELGCTVNDVKVG
ncbi:MAG: exodeoxyribonuclease VII large subunit [Firmicutes bacterium]|jgi:exodeoxyribonuclease VII large subunit|nr:exodeoxyribonuclease VII large subunit [Bacillota bacterium]MDD4337119.1 exodeoxyribonuclease VII large subunit [Bacillota bacterium]MDD4792086.1 exodeoxyribonuclease VII large subunit [Bacillota bacterium]